MPHGSLSLPARLCLLAWDTTAAEATGAGRLPSLVRAGALVELARHGLLVDEDDIATPADLDSETGDPVLDGLLELVRESMPHRWPAWVTLHARITLDAVREQLAADGHLRAEKRRVLGVFPSVDYALEGGTVVAALRAEARAALRGPVPVADLSEQDAAFAALAQAAGLLTDADESGGGAPERLEALIARGGAGAPVLRAVVQEVRAASVAASAAD